MWIRSNPVSLDSASDPWHLELGTHLIRLIDVVTENVDQLGPTSSASTNSRAPSRSFNAVNIYTGIF